MAGGACGFWGAGFEGPPRVDMATHGQVGRHHHDANGAIVRELEVEHAANAASSSNEHHDGLDDQVDEHAVGHDAFDQDEDAEVDEHGVPVHVHHSHERTKKPAA